MKSKREKKQVVTSLIASIFTFTALLFLAFFWKCEESKSDSRMRVEFAVNYIDNMLERANHATSSVLPLLGRAYNQTTVSTSRQALLKHPQIRGFSLTDGGSIYCSSLTENKRRPYYPELYLENKIRIYHSRENNDFPLMLLRTGNNINVSVITSINFYFVADILSIINAVPKVYFRIGHYGLSAQGKRILIRYPDKNFLHVLSRKFPYELDYHITPVSQLIWVWKAAWLIIPFSLLMALSVWWLTFKYFSRQPLLLDALKVGISSEEFIPYFQPILCAKTRGIIGCEVLIRWNHPLMGIISPEQFIPLAESSELIAPMTHQLLNKVKNTLVHLDDVLLSGFHISINISPGHLTRGYRMIVWPSWRHCLIVRQY